MAIPLLRETYAPVIIARLAEKRRRESGIDPEKALGTDIPVRKESVLRILWDNITRPVILLTRFASNSYRCKPWLIMSYVNRQITDLLHAERIHEPVSQSATLYQVVGCLTVTSYARLSIYG